MNRTTHAPCAAPRNLPAFSRRALRAAAATLGLVAALSVSNAAAAAEAASSDSPPPSAAERLLFMSPHLDGMKAPTTLRYQFVRTDNASAADSFKDSVEVQYARGKSIACCTVNGTFLTGERMIREPEVEDARANPLLMYYLEYEIKQLQRATKGGLAHFRRQMRLAFVDKAAVTQTQISWGGREVAATSIEVSPFLDDPFRSRFEREARKVYTFVMSDAVPGGIYQIRTRLPAEDGTTLLAEESLTLQPR